MRKEGCFKCALAMLALVGCNAFAASGQSDFQQRGKIIVDVWKGNKLSDALSSTCSGLKAPTDASDDRWALVTLCMVWHETNKVAESTNADIVSGRIGPENYRERLSPALLDALFKNGIDHQMADAEALVDQAEVEAEKHAQTKQQTKQPSNITGRWCWESPGFTAREANGPPSASLSLNLTTKGSIGSTVTGDHCAVMHWGDRIDCADEGETSISGLVREGYSSVIVTSAYSGKAVKARLFPAADRLRYVPIPMMGVEHYLPPNEVVLKRCGK